MRTPDAADPSRHCVALDGIRGLAALSVLLFHLGRWLDIPFFAVNGGLSVDTFFTLSGYVLARAYLSRVDSLSMADFVLMRWVRLMPIIVLSVALSAPYVLARNLMMESRSYLDIIFLAATFGVLNIPYFHAPAQIGGPQIFPLNGPQFSLFFELVVNYIWWSVRFLNQFYVSLTIFILSSTAIMSYGIGGDEADNFTLGFYHVGSSFFIGVIAYIVVGKIPSLLRDDWFFYALLAIMALVLFSPIELSFAGRMVWKLLLAPMLIVSGATFTVPPLFRRAASYVGELSYPIYSLHYPVFCWVNGAAQKILSGKSAAIEAPIIIVATIVIGHAVLIYYDKPVRRRLMHVLFKPA